MSRISELQREVEILRGRVQALEYQRLNGQAYKFKVRALYLDEPISPWLHGVLTLKPLERDRSTATYSGYIEIPLQNCTVDGYELVGPHGTTVKKRVGSQCFSLPGVYGVTVNWNEVI